MESEEVRLNEHEVIRNCSSSETVFNPHNEMDVRI
jgi:hypothetical protein